MKKTSLLFLLVISLSSPFLRAASLVTEINVTEIKTMKDYESLVTKSNTPLVIDFYRDNCGPCQRMKPIFKKLAQDPAYAGVRFLKIDIENDAVNDLINHYHIRSIPTFIFKKGQATSQRVGFIQETELRTLIDALIAD